MNRTRLSLLLLSLALLLAACVPTPDAPAPDGPALEETDVLYLTLDAHDIRWSEQAFTVTAGQPVTLRITNAGVLDHDFVLEALALEAKLSPDQSIELNFTFEEPGEYEFLCTVAGHIDAGMTGMFTVLPADE